MASSHDRQLQVYDACAASFREKPSNFSLAARSAGTSRRTARRMWEFGLPGLGKAPIKALLQHEQKLISERVATEDLHQRIIQAAQEEDAIVTAAREVIIARGVRNSVSGLIPIATKLRKLALRLVEHLEKVPVETMDPAEML